MPFPYLVTPAGKSREELCPRHNTDILQRVRGRHTHARKHTEVAEREAGRRGEEGWGRKRDRHEDKQRHRREKTGKRRRQESGVQSAPAEMDEEAERDDE